MDSDAGIMRWMVTTTITMIRWWMTSLLFLLMAPEVTTLPDYTLGRQAADFQVSTFFTEALSPSSPPPLKTGMAAANLPFTGDYVRLYDMEDPESILHVPSWKMYHWNGNCAGDQTFLKKSDWGRTSTSTNERQMCRTLKNMKPGFHNSSNQCGAALSWHWNIFREYMIWGKMGPRHRLPFFPYGSPMVLKCPAWGWSSSFHQRCRRTFCSSCWRRQTPALQSLSWQLCIPRTAKRLWCQSGRFGWWCLRFMCTFSSWRSQIFEVPWIITFDASIFSEHRGYFFPKTVVPGSIGYTAPKQRDTTNARCVAKCGRRSWSSGTCVQCKSSRLIPMGTNIIGETAGWVVKIFRVWWFSDLAMILC